MSRVRVLDVAKELNLDTKTTILKLQEIGVQVKNHFNALSDTEADKLRQYVKGGSKPGATGSAAKAGNRVVVVRRRVTEVDQPTVDLANAQQAEVAPPAPSAPEPVRIPTPQPVAQVATPKVETPVAAAPVVEDIKIPVAATTPTPAARVTTQAPTVSVAPPAAAPQAPSSVAVGSPSIDSPIPVAPASAPTPAAAAAAAPKANFQGAVIVRKAPDKPVAPPPPSGPAGYTQNMRSGQGQGGGGGYTPRPPGFTPSPPGTTGQGGTGVRTYDRSADGGNRAPTYTAGGSSGAGRPPARTPYSPQGGTNSGGYGAGGNRYGGAPGGGARPSFLNTPAPAETPADKTARPTRDKTRDQIKRRQHDEVDASKKPVKGRVREGEEAVGIDDYLEELQGEVEVTGDTAEVPLRTVYTPVPNRKKSFVGGGSGRRKDARKMQEAALPTKASKKVIRIEDAISVSDLASEMSVKVNAVVKSLMNLGVMATANQVLDFETAALVAQEYSFEVQNVALSIGDILAQNAQSLDIEQKVGISRPPVVTIMGHVDHGKTSLLDVIRSANVAGGEAGGITQHIGAYQIQHNDRKITFLDTPGHAAFTQMRARGAQVTDVVILVVAGDDGVMPQTIEAINHAKAANVPIIVAINKMDKPSADPERITRELSQHNVTPEEWGGDAMFVKVSAKEKTGINDLLEAILLQADVLDLKAPRDGQAHGVVIESKLEKSRGPVATVLVTQGTLKVQDWIVAGTTYGRVRAMQDAMGRKITVAEPSTPVEILGLGSVPASGDQFNGVANDDVAKEAVDYRIERQRLKDLASQSKPASLDDMFARMNEDAKKGNELSLIIKADTHGSVEAIRSSVLKLDTEKVKNRVLQAAVGGITESDVTLAHASKALILGFNVRPDKVAAQVAEEEGVLIQTYSIIYELIEAVEKAMVGKLAPIRSEKVIGHAEVRSLFSVPKVGVISGSAVSDGKIVRNAHVRVVRDNVVIYTGRIGSLKRFKEDAKEVLEGFECGIGVENYNDLKIGDVLESFIIEETAATLR